MVWKIVMSFKFKVSVQYLKLWQIRKLDNDMVYLISPFYYNTPINNTPKSHVINKTP